jgi:hypothetical protein
VNRGGKKTQEKAGFAGKTGQKKVNGCPGLFAAWIPDEEEISPYDLSFGKRTFIRSGRRENLLSRKRKG